MRYEAWLRRRLVVKTATLQTGERLVVDAYDARERMLIEAKASASRQDVRMAIGQLLDYRRHSDKKASLALLLPDRPTDDLVDLLHGLRVLVIFEAERRFKTLRP